MGMVGLAIIFAPAIGPTIAGYVLEHYSWRTLFYGMIPFVVIVIAVAFIYLKNVAERSYPKIDIWGAILSTIGFGALLYGFSSAGSKGWSSAEVIRIYCCRCCLLDFVYMATVGHPRARFLISGRSNTACSP